MQASTPMKRAKPRKYSFHTRDGWRLAAYRYGNGERTSAWGPVMLVHGLGANRYNLDAPVPEISVAQFLHQQGHDVWVVELRGAGGSRPSAWPLVRRRQFDFDDYVHRDVPALVRGILDHTGASALHWVGHSMGGMLAYAALEHFDQSLFRSVVTVGSPAFTQMKHPSVDQLYRMRFMLHLVPWVPQKHLAKVAVLFPGLTIRTVGRVFANPGAMDPKHVRSLAWHVPQNLPSRLLRQFAEWYGGEGGFTRHDGLLDYYDHLGRIRAPMLIIAGAGDRLSPVADLRHVFESIRSEDKQLLVCGEDQGFSVDYGHIDLVLGTRARQEVYPHILRWIERH